MRTRGNAAPYVQVYCPFPLTIIALSPMGGDPWSKTSAQEAEHGLFLRLVMLRSSSCMREWGQARVSIHGNRIAIVQERVPFCPHGGGTSTGGVMRHALFCFRHCIVLAVATNFHFIR